MQSVLSFSLAKKINRGPRNANEEIVRTAVEDKLEKQYSKQSGQ